jgi:hypothetical protein
MNRNATLLGGRPSSSGFFLPVNQGNNDPKVGTHGKRSPRHHSYCELPFLDDIL